MNAEPGRSLDATDAAATAAHAPGRWLWVALAFAAAALGLSSFLTAQSLIEGVSAPGCGGGSGCGQVLTSKWSRLGPIPVSALAGVLYVLCICALLALRLGAGAAQRAAWAVLMVGCGGVVAAAGWFIYLQAAVIGAWCAYCLTDHALGIAMVGTVLFGVVAAPHRTALPRGMGAGALVLGALGIVPIALVQSQSAPPEAYVTHELPTDQDYDLTRNGARHLSVLGGALQLDLSENPVIGSTDRAHVIVMMLDFACPHCQDTHQFLRQYQNESEDAPAFVVVPTPVNPACNPHMPPASDRFEESCELARLALAVHLADADAFDGYDRWLYEPTGRDFPRSADAARAEAARRVGEAALKEALASDRLEQMMQRNVDAYGASGADRVPVLIAPFADRLINSTVTRADPIRKLLAQSEAGASASAAAADEEADGRDQRLQAAE